jgi:hypothetical protein
MAALLVALKKPRRSHMEKGCKSGTEDIHGVSLRKEMRKHNTHSVCRKDHRRGSMRCAAGVSRMNEAKSDREGCMQDVGVYQDFDNGKNWCDVPG